MCELEDRARVIAHPAHEEGVEDERSLGAAPRLGHGGADTREVGDDLVRRALGKSCANRGLVEGTLRGSLRAREKGRVGVDRGIRGAALAELGDDTLGSDLVELVDRDEHAGTLVRGETEALEHPVECPAVV